MPIINEKPFQKQRLDEEKAKDKSEVLTIRINLGERELLEQVKKVIEQPKDSTAIKTLLKIGAFDVLHDKKTNFLINTLFKNKRNNERLGIPDFE